MGEIFWAHGKMGCSMHAPLWEKLGSQAIASVHSLSAKTVANTMWPLSKMNMSDKLALDLVAVMS